MERLPEILQQRDQDPQIPAVSLFKTMKLLQSLSAMQKFFCLIIQ